ncbi:MAG: bifunctional diaminohydroxyphosphoribosylaminopyrimidine deaminase/5-amino-6-(5-phosphoribosylamino)uracil reductase RibD [Flavobacteriales bacterium]
MYRAIQIAQNALGNVAPNPLVGALVVYDGKIISEGYHAAFGESHAEIMALNKIHDPEILRKSTLYVTLEPCSHFGKTPPCSDLIIEKGIPRVVIAAKDPFEKVNGSGIERLKNNGIQVITGVLEKEAIEMNRRFFTFHTKKRPYVILKWAQTADGYMDRVRTNNTDLGSFSISCAESAILVHQWRSEESGILIGATTALTDNPSLTVRHVKGKNPTRILIDPNGKVPANYAIFNTEAPTVVFGESSHMGAFVLPFVKTNAITNILIELYKLDIQSVLVEGGAETLKHFIDACCWDEARIITAPKALGKGLKAPEISINKNSCFRCGIDEIFYYRNND